LSTGSGGSFEADYWHSGRITKFDKLYVLINTSVNGSNAAYFCYDPDTNVLKLRSNGDNCWMSGVVGSSGYLANGQVSVRLADVQTGSEGNMIFGLIIPMEFTSTFAGAKNIYMFARDKYGQSTGWDQVSSYTVDTTNRVPVNLFLNPTNSSGPAKKFTVTFRDGDGWKNIKNVFFLINTAKDGSNAFYIAYAPSINTVYLRNNTDTGWSWGTIGEDKVLFNSQGRINLKDISVTRVGFDVTLEFTAGFYSSFNGSKNVYLFTRDRANQKTGWEKFGEITVNVP
jgi:hypothetical protein